jgi:hypothetical protein
MAKVTKARHRSALRILDSRARTTAALGLDGKKPHPPRWNKELMCHLDDWVKYPTGEVNLIVGRGERTDMRGAIKVATTLLPKVHRIDVFDDQHLHTVYQRTDDTWEAFTQESMSTTGRIPRIIPDPHYWEENHPYLLGRDVKPEGKSNDYSISCRHDGFRTAGLPPRDTGRTIKDTDPYSGD